MAEHALPPAAEHVYGTVEECAWCGGDGRMHSAINFLLLRLRVGGDYRWIGSAPNAMVLAAITGEPPKRRPYDGWDLGRCLVTRAVAPPELHERMDAIIADWVALLESESPYHGVEAARSMLVDHEAEVRATIAAVGPNPYPSRRSNDAATPALGETPERSSPDG